LLELLRGYFLNLFESLLVPVEFGVKSVTPRALDFPETLLTEDLKVKTGLFDPFLRYLGDVGILSEEGRILLLFLCFWILFLSDNGLELINPLVKGRAGFQFYLPWYFLLGVVVVFEDLDVDGTEKAALRLLHFFLLNVTHVTLGQLFLRKAELVRLWHYCRL
jgi:hypothetical protein